MFRFARAKIALIVAVLAGGALPIAPAPAAPTGFVAMTDGISIAVNVRMPKNVTSGGRYPAVLDMSGYDGGSASDYTLTGDILGPDAPLAPDGRRFTHIYEENYVTVHASVRGTGCSSGEFDLFSWRTALDGYEVIEWMAKQPWSNGDVALSGQSYAGMTAFMIAATRPPSLRAMSLSGLFDDLYRGITYPGGVSNYGFPLLWAGGLRNFYDVGGGTAPGLARPAPDDPDGIRRGCAQNLLTHRRTVSNDPIMQGLVGDTDNDWYRSRSLITYAHLISVPTHITATYQDEQSGARGPTRLWEALSVPKRLVLSNGDHPTNSPCCGPDAMVRERTGWLDHYVRNDDSIAEELDVDFSEPESVRVLLELHTEDGRLVPNGIKDARTFPLEDTVWTDYYLKGDGGLTLDGPSTQETARSYLSGTKRHSWSYEAGYAVGAPVTTAGGPDELIYRTTPFAAPAALVGPSTATLFMQTTGVDTELFVQLADVGPDGSRTYLQRGLLKASHRSIDRAHSDCVDQANAKVSCKDASAAVMYRPHRPHTNPEPVEPLETIEYLVEIWPVGHVFRAGHSLEVMVTDPPASDSFYAYIPKVAPAVNTVLQGPSAPSRVTLGMVPLTGVTLGPEIPCGGQTWVRCVKG